MNEYLELVNEEIERLQSEIDSLKSQIRNKNEIIDHLSEEVAKFAKFKDFTRVVKIYHHKSRGNTTIKFADDSVSTVKLRKGDKDCLETAIAWALAKHIYNISKIARDTEEVTDARGTKRTTRQTDSECRCRKTR